jgi:pimeloyl-ACP methyl ester carboxylesterase
MSIATAVRRHATLNGNAVSWLEWPDAGATTHCSVILLHGILQSADPGSHIARHLSCGHRVIMPDLRGRGETALPAGGADPASMAADVAALIDLLELERVVVIGRNHGGVVGYHLAAGWPDRVHGLVLGDSTPEVDAARAARRLEIIRAFPASFTSLDAAMDFYQNRLGLSEARARHDIPNDLDEVNGSFIWRHNLDAILEIERAAAPRADWDILVRVAAPTLILRGQRGRIAPEIAQRMLATMPNAQVQTIFGAGSDVYLGPGSEQSRGAIDMFLVRLSEAAHS